MKSDSPKIYISGATGFLGKNLLNYLSVKALDCTALNLRQEFTAETIADADVIIHLAGKAHDLKNTTDAEEYFKINYELTKKLFDLFLQSEAEKFIFISSVKAIVDHSADLVTEETLAYPATSYGLSKQKAENYILNSGRAVNKKVYILRPCMIHGPGNKGNLNMLFRFVQTGIPWPLGSFSNERSFCSVENICFAMHELSVRNDIPSGIYNVADDEAISTNELIRLIGQACGKKPKILNIPEKWISALARLGDKLHLPFTSERLEKLTESYRVSNRKLVTALGNPLPVKTKTGLLKTIAFFKQKKGHNQ